MTDHEAWDELAAGYALHALDADEQVRFVEHLQGCDECTASVKDHELVAAQLGSIAHYRESDEGDAPSWESMRAAIVGDRDAPAAVTDLAARRNRYTATRRALAVAAAAAVLAGGGVATWRLSTGGSGCSASAGCHRIELDAAGGRVKAAVVVHGATVTITPTDMPSAPAGKVYVLWQLPRDGSATPIGSFRAGTGTTQRLPVDYAGTEAFAISEESVSAAPYSRPSNNLAEGVAS